MLDAWELKLEILVLDGTQFIGLRLVELLVRQSHRVTVLNRGISPATLPESVSPGDWRPLQRDRAAAPVVYGPHNSILSQI